MASSAVSVLSAAGPLTRAAAAMARHDGLRAATQVVMRGMGAAQPAKHAAARRPLTPAALRIERARSTRNGERSEQTAVTVWFGRGPSLPVPGGTDGMRSAVRIGTGLIGAAALAAMTVIAARREEERERVVEAARTAVTVR